MKKQKQKNSEYEVSNTGKHKGITFAASRSFRNWVLAWSLVKALLRAPTGVAGPSSVAVGKETCLLSFSITIKLESRYPALFMASYA